MPRMLTGTWATAYHQLRNDHLVGGPDRKLFQWISDRTGLIWSDDFKGVGRVIRGNLVCVAGYNSHTGASCNLHLAGDGYAWMNREFLRMMFEVPFGQWGYNVLTAPISSANGKSRNLAIRLGFTEFGIINDAHPEGALIIYMLRREHCRWFSDGKR